MALAPNGTTYTTYVPTWTSNGSAPAIGNAAVVARYLQIGKLVHAYGQITFGSTSTFGSGNYAFALPVTASATAALAANAPGGGVIYDASAAKVGQPACYVATTATLGFEFGATYLGTLTLFDASTPWVWAVSDIIAWNITYEAA